MHVVIMPQIVSKVEICKTKLWIPKMCHVCVCCLEALAFIHVILLCLLSLFSHQGSLFIYHLLIPPPCCWIIFVLSVVNHWNHFHFVFLVSSCQVFLDFLCFHLPLAVVVSFVFVSLCKCVFSFRLLFLFPHPKSFFFSEKFKKVE